MAFHSSDKNVAGPYFQAELAVVLPGVGNTRLRLISNQLIDCKQTKSLGDLYEGLHVNFGSDTFTRFL